MLEHGEFSIEVEGQVVHVYPIGSFNEKGIAKLCKAVLAVKPEGKWALFEHPRDVAGVTPDAAFELAASYKRMSENGCEAVAVEVIRLWHDIIHDACRGEVTIPVFVDDNVTPLRSELKQYLSS